MYTEEEFKDIDEATDRKVAALLADPSALKHAQAVTSAIIVLATSIGEPGFQCLSIAVALLREKGMTDEQIHTGAQLQLDMLAKYRDRMTTPKEPANGS